MVHTLMTPCFLDCALGNATRSTWFSTLLPQVKVFSKCQHLLPKSTLFHVVCIIPGHRDQGPHPCFPCFLFTSHRWTIIQILPLQQAATPKVSSDPQHVVELGWQPHIQKPCLQTLESKASDHSQDYRGLELSSDLKQHRLPGSLQYGFWRFQECLFGNRLWNSVYL